MDYISTISTFSNFLIKNIARLCWTEQTRSGTQVWANLENPSEWSRVGYEVIAINNASDEVSLKTSSKNSKKLPATINSPKHILPSEKEIQDIKSSLGIKKEVHIKSRFTLNFTHMDQTRRMQQDEIIQSYDLLAVRTEDESLLKHACETMNVDVISLQLEEKLPLKMKGKVLQMAARRGVYFEVSYSPAVRDPTYRRFVVSSASRIVEATRGKNIILTSGCENEMELRGPNEVRNFGLMLKLTPDQSRDSITTNCQSCLHHRKYDGFLPPKAIISIERMSKEPQKDGALIGSSKIGGSTETKNEQSMHDSRKRTDVYEGEPKTKKLKQMEKNVAS